MEWKSRNGRSASMADFVGVFQGIVENPVSRYALRKVVEECPKDHGSRIQVGLERYLGLRDSTCQYCTMASYLVALLLKGGAATFGIDEQQLRDGLADPYWRKGLLNVINGIAEFGVRKPFAPGAPFQIVWNITRACNLRCQHCYENAGKRDADELSDEQIMEGIETIAKANVSSLAFSGGEPTIHPSILQFIGLAYDLGLYVSIATNGYNFASSRTVREFKDAGLGFAQISLDGLSPQVHDSFRGVRGSWDAAVRAIENCVAEGVTVCMSTTVTKHNQTEIPMLLDFARDLGVKWYMLYNFIPTGRGTSIASKDLSPEERRESLITAFQANCSGFQVLSTAPQYGPLAKEMSSDEGIIPTHFYNASYGQKTKSLADFIGGCGAGRFYLAAEPNGDLYPCVFLPHVESLKLGNLLDGNFSDIWREHNLLHLLRNKDELHGHCSRCENRYICGGCRARAYAYFDDILAPDPGCLNNIEYWDMIKRAANKAERTREADVMIR